MKTIFALLLLSLIVGCSSNNKYSISGSFKEKQGEEWIYLLKFSDYETKIDSAKIVNGSFEFSGSVEIPEIYYLSYHPILTEDAFAFFIEPEELEIIVDPTNWYKGSEISGGAVNEEFKRLEEKIKDEYNTILLEIDDTYSPTDKKNRDIYEQERQKLEKRILEMRKDYVLNNPNSPISIVYLHKFYYKMPLSELGEILNSFSKPVQLTSWYARIAEFYEIGIDQKDSPEFKANSDEVSVMKEISKGTSVLEALIERNPNKILYIDIWGTWCGPCKKEFPYSRRLHGEIDTSKVAFIYLCVKSEEEKWKDMIEVENLKGQHYLLDRELERALYKEIGGQSYYPRYVIINKSGEIENSVAPRPSSPEIEKLLADLSS